MFVGKDEEVNGEFAKLLQDRWHISKECQLVRGRWRINENILKVKEGSEHTVESRCGQKELHVFSTTG
jgi:hypothetical protein